MSVVMGVKPSCDGRTRRGQWLAVRKGRNDVAWAPFATPAGCCDPGEALPAPLGVPAARWNAVVKLLGGRAGRPPSFSKLALPVQDRLSIYFERLGA